MIEVTDFRNAMSMLTSAVNVITTAGVSGRYGFTASAVCGVTDTPPTLLVCMNRASRSHGHFVQNKILTVNVLGAQHQQISKVFSSQMSPEQRFEYGNWTQLSTGAPVLTDALVSFDCQIEHIQEVGTHSIFICPIVAVQHGQQQPSQQDQSQKNQVQQNQVEQNQAQQNHGQQQQGLAYFNRAYHSIGHRNTSDQNTDQQGTDYQDNGQQNTSHQSIAQQASQHTNQAETA